MAPTDEVARTRLDSHENECARRYEEITTALGSINSSIGKLFDRFWLAALGLISMLVGLCGFLAFTVFTGYF